MACSASAIGIKLSFVSFGIPSHRRIHLGAPFRKWMRSEERFPDGSVAIVSSRGNNGFTFYGDVPWVLFEVSDECLPADFSGNISGQNANANSRESVHLKHLRLELCPCAAVHNVQGVKWEVCMTNFWQAKFIDLYYLLIFIKCIVFY